MGLHQDIAGWSLSLTQSTNATYPGGSVSLTATASQDVGPTPWYILLYDRGANALLNYCGSGTSCSTTVSQSSATTRVYIAYVADYSNTLPRAGTIAATSNIVSVTWLAISVSASPLWLGPGGTTTVTGTANTDVGPTPYWIELYDASTHAFLKRCPSGSSCSVGVSQGAPTIHSYIAFVSGYGTSWWPPATQAASGTVAVVWFGVSLSASPAALAPGGTTTLTATANSNVTPTPYYITIYDTDGALVKPCPQGTSCSVAVTQSGSVYKNYVAYVGGNQATLPPSPALAVSNYVQVSWIGATLGATSTALPPTASTTLIANTTLQLQSTPYALQIFDLTAGGPYLTTCGSGDTCSTTVSQAQATQHNFAAEVVCATPTCQAPATRAVSNTVTVTWLGVSLYECGGNQPACNASGNANGTVWGNPVTLTAVANTNIQYTTYFINIFDAGNGQQVASCNTGSSCTKSFTSGNAGTHQYVAYVETADTPPAVAAGSNIVSIYWVFWGVDSYDPVTPAMWSSVVSALGTPDFWGRYIGQTGAAPDMTAAEATVVHSNGSKILPIFTDYPQGSTNGYSTGTSYAQYAAQAAINLGIPTGTMIAIDIEPSSSVDGPFIQGWYDEMLKLGYVPAVYGDPYSGAPFAAAYCAAVGSEPAIGSGLILWPFEPSLSHLARNAAYQFNPAQPPCANQTRVWQYNLSAGSNPNVDLDEALQSAPMW